MCNDEISLKTIGISKSRHDLNLNDSLRIFDLLIELMFRTNYYNLSNSEMQIYEAHW